MSEPMKRMDHMVFNVKDLDVAVDFYTRVVGMKVSMRFEDRRMAFLSFGDRLGDVRLFEQGEQYPHDRHWHGFNHVAFLPDGGEEALEALHQRLIDQGANIEGTEEFAGGRHKSVYFYDPDGNRLEFYWESPSWIMECRGKVARAYGLGDAAADSEPAIELFAAGTPNGVKAGIALHLLDIPYRLVPVKLAGDAPRPDGFEAASATGKIPAIVDHENGANICESGAILIYLAEKARRTDLLPSAPVERAATMQWLFVASSTFGPALGTAHHYLHFNQGKAPYTEERSRKEVARIYATAEKALAKHDHLAGDQLTLGDISLWPWVVRSEWQGIDLADYPHVRDWYVRLAGMEAFRKGYDLMGEGREAPMP